MVDDIDARNLNSPRVTVNNALVNGVPSESFSAVTINSTVSFGNTVSVSTGSSDPRFRVRMSNTSANYFEANNMVWAQPNTGGNGFTDISMGQYDDTLILDRSAVAGTADMGAGNDKASLNNSYVNQLNMGAGNDHVLVTGDGALSGEEFAIKASEVGTDSSRLMDVDGGSGTDTLQLGGFFSVTLSSGSVFLNGSWVNTFTHRNFSLITGFQGTMNGTVSFPDYTVNGVVYPSQMRFTNFEAFENYCFTQGTQIETPDGLVPIESLRKGDIIITRHGPKVLKWLGATRFDSIDLAVHPKLMPVRIPAGAFGEGLPTQDLHLSPQHRVVIRSKIARNMFDTEEVLAAVKQLVGVNGIHVDNGMREVTYYHLMFDQHTTLNVYGIEAETLYPGPEVLKALTDEAREELLAIFPELANEAECSFAAILPILKGRNARALAMRHAKNSQPFYSQEL